MRKVWRPPARWVFLVATLLGLFSAAQSYRLLTLNPKARVDGIELGSVVILNLCLWYVPAALIGPIFRVADRFRLDGQRWLRAIAFHAGAAVAFSIIHVSAMLAVRVLLWPDMLEMPAPKWMSYAQDQYLRNLDWSLMTYAAVVGLSYALGYYRESQARALKEAHLESSLMEARLKTLEAELHPHFLFNTLHAISALMHRDVQAADRMLSRLSDLLRLTLDSVTRPEIRLFEEMEFLEKYASIEQVRMGDRLAIEFDVDADVLDAAVPALVLQPLVENAIKHGIAPSGRPGRVAIGARRDGEMLIMTVDDTGSGPNERAMAALSTGIGVSNTRARLTHQFGSRYRFEFQRHPNGFTVLVGIPYRQEPAAISIAEFVA